MSSIADGLTQLVNLQLQRPAHVEPGSTEQACDGELRAQLAAEVAAAPPSAVVSKEALAAFKQQLLAASSSPSKTRTSRPAKT